MGFVKLIKRTIGTIFCFGFILLFALSIFAHPGSTDGSGGHYDSSTGEYHYHHGYPEHQHTNGECPYNFKNQTGSQIGDSYFSGNTTSYENQLDEETEKPESERDSAIAAIEKEYKHNKGISIAAVSAVAFAFACCFGYYYKNEVY